MHKAWFRRFSVGALVLALAGVGVVSAPTASAAGEGPHVQFAPGPQMVVLAGPGVANTSIPAPPRAGVSAQQAAFSVNYVGFPAPAQTAFQAAVNIWASLLASPVPIVIDASWEPLGTNQLGGAGATESARNFTGAPQADTWYPKSLANALSGSNLDSRRTVPTKRSASALA
jgi:hypothetical protein